MCRLWSAIKPGTPALPLLLPASQVGSWMDTYLPLCRLGSLGNGSEAEMCMQGLTMSCSRDHTQEAVRAARQGRGGNRTGKFQQRPQPTPVAGMAPGHCPQLRPGGRPVCLNIVLPQGRGVTLGQRALCLRAIPEEELLGTECLCPWPNSNVDVLILSVTAFGGGASKDIILAECHTGGALIL